MLNKRLTVRMDRSVAGQNWHGPEADPSGEYCWTGPGARATLSLSVRRDREMLGVVAYYMPVVKEQLRGFRVEVDGVTVPHSIRADINPKCIVIRLPARSTPSNDVTELGLVLPHTVSPSSLPNGSPDERLLGLAVFWVSVIPIEPALPIRSWVSCFESVRRRMGLSRRYRPSGNFPVSHFDGLAYMEANPEVAEAVIEGSMPSALDHYRRHGSKDGWRFTLAVARAPIEGSMADLFDGLAYLKIYPDVADAVRSETQPSAIEHYLKYGRKEGRKIPTRLDGQVRRGTALDLVQLDAAHLAQADIDVLRGELRRIERLSSEGMEQVQAQLGTLARARQAREQDLLFQVDALRSGSVEVRRGLAAAARADDVARLQQETLQRMDKLRGEFAEALARGNALLEQLDTFKSGLAETQKEVSVAARAADLEQLKRDESRELERVRGEIAAALTLREAREQAVLEQLELLRIGLDESQRRLSVTARAEDLDRLKRDAVKDLERLRSEITSTSAVESARGQALFDQIDALKAEVDSEKARAESAEVKVASAQRKLGNEARDIAKSVQQSSAALNRLRDEIAGTNDLRDSNETVIKTELELLKHELIVSQMANFAAPATKGGKRKGSGKSCSQLGQDLWVLQKTEFKKGGYFVDIGATDGVLLSNTYLLEKHYGWKGICIEPDPVAFKKLSQNRESFCSNACLWSSSGLELDFILAKEYGAISDTAELDAHADKRRAYRKIGQTIKVKTTSLNDLLEDAKVPKVIDYISLDTEGSEYEIISAFDFNRWTVRLWTIEHNHTDQRQRIFELMSANGYKRREVEWDDWYFL